MWKNDGSDGIAWHIRGINPDARFYGELRFDSADASKRKYVLLEGSIPPGDWSHVQELLQSFGQPISEPKPCYALIVRWDGTNDQITFQYNLGDEVHSVEAKRFLELHDLLEKEISKSYKEIT